MKRLSSFNHLLVIPPKEVAPFVAASPEFLMAQYNIAKMLEAGKRVPQSYAKARMWYYIRAANGYSDGARKRDKVAKRMTSDQIAEA